MRTALVILVAALAAGCGTRQPAAPTAAEQPRGRCTHASHGFRACTTFRALGERSAIYRRHGNGWTRVTAGVPGRPGWWRRVLASEDGRTLLGQWSGECEIQSTYLVAARGGRPRPIFAGAESSALGWSGDHRARVLLPRAVIGQDRRMDLRAGTYLVDPVSLRAELERRVRSRPGC